MIIVESQERGEVDIDIDLIIKDGKNIDIYNNVSNFFKIDYKPKLNKLTLVCGKYVGLIPVNNSLSINIKPKVSISNLTRMITLSGININSLNFFKRGYSMTSRESLMTFRFMTEAFLQELKLLYQEGILKIYVKNESISSNVKGRIDFHRSVQQLWSKGNFSRVAIKYDYLTSDNRANQLIKAALINCLNTLRQDIKCTNDLINEICFYLSIFEGVTCQDKSSFLNSRTSDFNLGELRDYYENVLEISHLILFNHDVNLNASGESFNFNSFYLNLEIVFEKYLFAVIKKTLVKLIDKYTVLDGNTNGKKMLFNTPSFAKNYAKPDIIINNSEGACIICDAKYKTQKSDSDRYQIISHAMSYNARACVLISPRPEGYIGGALVKLGSIGRDFIISVYDYYIDLSTENILDEETKLSDELFNLINNL